MTIAPVSTVFVPIPPATQNFRVEREQVSLLLQKLVPKHIRPTLFAMVEAEFHKQIEQWVNKVSQSGAQGGRFFFPVSKAIDALGALGVWIFVDQEKVYLIGDSSKDEPYLSGERVKEYPTWELVLYRTPAGSSLSSSSLLKISGVHEPLPGTLSFCDQGALFVKRPTGLRSLALLLRDSGLEMPMADFLAIARGLWTAQPHGDTASLIPAAILISEFSTERYLRLESGFPHPILPARETYAKKSFANAWVLWMAELLFYDLEKRPSCDRWGEEALFRIREALSPSLYSQMEHLSREHPTFGVEFPQAVLRLMQEKKEELAIDGFSQSILEEFAYRMLFFPWVAPLLQIILEGGVCSPELITEGLARTNAQFEALVSSRPTSCCERLSPEATQQIASRIWTAQEVGPKAEALSHIVNRALSQAAYLGKEERFHRGERWQGSEVPLSFRMSPIAVGVELELFSGKLLGAGAYRKVKAGWEAEIVGKVGELRLFKPVALYRQKGRCDEDYLHGMRMQEEILRIPGAQDYFLPTPKRHSGYAVNGRMKWEGSMLYCVGDMRSLIETRKVGEIGVSSRKLLGLVRHIGEGIRLIAEKGISHGDLKPSNVLVQFQEVSRSVQPLIADFDWTLPFGATEFHASSVAYLWDRARREEGMVSQRTDLYAWILIVSQALSFGLNAELSRENDSRVLSRLEEIRKAPQFYADQLSCNFTNYFLRQFPKFKDLTKDQIADQAKSLLARGEERKKVALMRLFLIESQWIPHGINLLTWALNADLPSSTPGRPPFPTYDQVVAILTACEKMIAEVDMRLGI